jgi:hypothetical protein
MKDAEAKRSFWRFGDPVHRRRARQRALCMRHAVKPMLPIIDKSDESSERGRLLRPAAAYVL